MHDVINGTVDLGIRVDTGIIDHAEVDGDGNYLLRYKSDDGYPVPSEIRFTDDECTSRFAFGHSRGKSVRVLSDTCNMVFSVEINSVPVMRREPHTGPIIIYACPKTPGGT